MTGFEPTPAPAETGPAPGAQAGTDVQASIVLALRQMLVRDYGAAPGLAADAPLISAGLVDSAGVAELIDWIEHRYAIRVDDDDVTFENFETLNALAELVRRSSSAKS